MGTKTIKIPYPEDLPNRMGTTPEEFEKEIKFFVAAKLYELGRLSSGKAADMAGLSRVKFLENLSRYRISVFNYSLDDLELEIKEARLRSERAG
jgi:predicted HTH domain antitoxin